MTVTPNENAPGGPSPVEPSPAVEARRISRALQRLSRARFLAATPASEATGAAAPIPSETLLQTALLALGLTGRERVLELGSRTGYETALLSQLAGEVYSLAPGPDALGPRSELLGLTGCRNVNLVVGPGGDGWPSAAPFSAIFVASGAAQIPAALYDQLEVDGRLVIPLGDASGQLLELVRRRPDGFTSETLTSCHLAMLPWASRRPSSFPWRKVRG